MEFTANQIAQLLQGRVEGDENVVVNNLCKIEDGEEKGLSFLANPKYEHYVYDTNASIVIVNNSFVPEREIKTTLIRVEDAYSCFAKLLEVYSQYRLNKTGISSLSFISDKAKIEPEPYVGEFAVISQDVVIGKNAKIYPNVYIGDNVRIGDNVIIYAGVKIYHDCVIGNNCVIHAGAVIGSDGFGFAPLSDGSFKKVEQIGNVVIEDDVEIGANTTIDRATMGSTRIMKGAKIDNLCQIAHNCVIGNSTVMAAQVGVAGSTKIGNYCFVGGQAGFAGHLTIGNMVKVGAQAGIIADVKDNETIVGAPAIDAKSYMRSYVFYRKLPDISKKIDQLEKRIKELENK